MLTHPTLKRYALKSEATPSELKCNIQFFSATRLKQSPRHPPSIEEIFLSYLRTYRKLRAEIASSSSKILKAHHIPYCTGMPDVVVEKKDGSIMFYEVKSLKDGIRKEQIEFILANLNKYEIIIAYVGLVLARIDDDDKSDFLKRRKKKSVRYYMNVTRKRKHNRYLKRQENASDNQAAHLDAEENKLLNLLDDTANDMF
jgi:hypothetical protein